jgi:hypothetical protein
MRYFIQIEIKNAEDKFRVKRVLAHLLSSPGEWDGPLPETEMTCRETGGIQELHAYERDGFTMKGHVNPIGGL